MNSTKQHRLRIVPHLDTSSALVFPIMEYTLSGSTVLKIGRSIAENLNRRTISNSLHMTFRSKVVSRKHAEIFIQDDKVYIRDLESSSGTFLNSRRLCAPNQISKPFELHNNDIIQLGVDYQGGTQDIYRAVKMKLELNKPQQQQSDVLSSYNLKTYTALRNLGLPSCSSTDPDQDIHVDECCICLFAIAPFQALFVAPCSHTFHFKCLRPLLSNYPGFSCPLCRNYADLDASVAIEAEEVKTMIKKIKIPIPL